MQALISQNLLPMTLCLMMFSMGLGLSKQDFKGALSQPKLAITGLSLQFLLLPTLALAVIGFFSLPEIAAAGLFLLALCPGGATSNLFSYLARGNVALSISLTAIGSLIVPFSLPFLFGLFMHFSGEPLHFTLPLWLVIKQLLLVSLLPVVLGMLTRVYFSDFTRRIELRLKRVATFCMLGIILALVLTNLHIMNMMFSSSGLAVLSLCCLSLLLSYKLAHILKFEKEVTRTLAIETGVQNAGIAMLVALSILQQPQLASVPLIYGLLMNLPVFTFIFYCRNKKGAKLAPT